ncbi:unnamed protein product [Rotaria socialis]|uniref:Uncharacterized protein n=1 Tax=Rotaria socialis TaxID=392032 RepID=A0A820XRI6_9BILA|nr:unnamed protein product [Rotaria socialis]CAF4536668.1 unnamed protein product [Rotaria socialis]
MFISSIRPYQSAGEIKCSQSSKLRCSGTNKCILKRHIMDGIRHCYNGFDESIAANSYHHPCVFPNTPTVGCLHFNRVYDGIVDCLGATDKREFCHLTYSEVGYKRYRCWNDSKCVSVESRCKNSHGVGELSGHHFQSITGDFELTSEQHKGHKLPFSSKSSRENPKTKVILPGDKIILNQTLQTKHLDSIKQLDPHQGIFIYYGKNGSEKCLCQPA